jgi:hypothetical protein
MEELDYGAKAVDQFAMLVTVSFERLCSVLKQLRDSIGRVTILELVGERVFCEIYPGLLSVVGQCFGDQLKVRRGRCCQGHGARGWHRCSVRLVREMTGKELGGILGCTALKLIIRANASKTYDWPSYGWPDMGGIDAERA